MGLSCKPVGKLGGKFKKLDNELAKIAATQKKPKATKEEKSES